MPAGSDPAAAANAPSATRGKLWDKQEPLDALIEQFTVGDDYLLDRHLVAADCVASLAHAVMLERIGVLAAAELAELRAGLLEALRLAAGGQLAVTLADEDVHTALERFLSDRGAAGAKIHTARSRNDQVMAALRLYSRAYLLELQAALLDLIDALLALARRHAATTMPGRTHTQVAMPSTFGLWAAAWAEELHDDIELLVTCYRLTNRSPLGSAAGYGTPMAVDRELVAQLLGFAGAQHNVLAASNSRGKLEAITLDALEQVALTASRMAEDLILFSLPELGYVRLPVELCTGSSIMPHKHNPDGLELIRARAATVAGYSTAVKAVVRNLPSGYSRDLQETKRPLLAGMEAVLGQVLVMEATIRRMTVDEAALTRALTPELFATDAALALVDRGMAFRDAYRKVAATGTEADAEQLQDLAAQALARRSAVGAAGNLGLAARTGIAADERQRVEEERRRVAAALRALTGVDATIYRNPYAGEDRQHGA